jgi:Flp pilus assembly secretin CpaC
MKIPRMKSPGFASLIAVAVAASFVLTSTGCKRKEPLVEKEPPAEKQKPVGINVEMQVFSMPRALAAATVLNQPADTDYATVLKNVQALVAEKKATLVATPTLTTMSGQRAVLESILEHKYPTEFSQPQIPQTFGAAEPPKRVTKTTIITEESGGSSPRTAATPTAFEKRDVGITLEMEPTASEDRTEISIQMAVSHVALQGTVKYKTDNNGEIEQPEFYTKKISTNLTLKNGVVALLGTIEPDKTLTKGEDLTEVVFVRATVR